MSSDDEGGGHPLNAVIAQQEARRRHAKAKERSIVAAAELLTAVAGDDEAQSDGGDLDGSAAPAEQESDDVEEQQATADDAAGKNKKKKSKKKKKKVSLQLGNVTHHDHVTPVADKTQTTLLMDGQEDTIPTRPATAPPQLGERGKPAVTVQSLNRTLQFVEDAQEIVQTVELRKLTRAPRYFDDDAGVETSTKRCFNCGQMGHLANQCTNDARKRPCYLCAQLDHEAKDCHNRLCFKCGRPGHVSRDCQGEGRAEGWAAASVCCNRCGSTTSCACVGKGDYLRYEGGCTGSYSAEDLKHCRCYVCGKRGHLCCKAPPKIPGFNTTCYYCGRSGHLGEQCPDDTRTHLTAERAGDVKRAQAALEWELQQQQAAQQRSYSDMGGGGVGRSKSVGARLQHMRFGTDEDEYNDRAIRAKQQDYARPANHRSDAYQPQAYDNRAATAPRQRGGNNQAPYYQHNPQSQHYNSPGYGGGPPGGSRYSTPTYNYQQQQQQPQQSMAYGGGNGQGGWPPVGYGMDRSNSVSMYSPQYGHTYEQQQQRYRQASTQQQQYAAAENQYMQRQWSGNTSTAGHKRGRYDDNDYYPNQRRR